jgi:hypothetical protein
MKFEFESLNNRLVSFLPRDLFSGVCLNDKRKKDTEKAELLAEGKMKEDLKKRRGTYFRLR